MDLSLDFSKMSVAERIQAQENRNNYLAKFPTKASFWKDYEKFRIDYKYRKEEFVPSWKMVGHQLIHYLKDNIKKLSVDNIIKVNSVDKFCKSKGGMSWKQERLIRVIAMNLYKAQ